MKDYWEQTVQVGDVIFYSVNALGKQKSTHAQVTGIEWSERHQQDVLKVLLRAENNVRRIAEIKREGAFVICPGKEL